MLKSEYEVKLPAYRKHPKQAAFVDCTAKRIVVRAGRRGGKTTGVAIRAVKRFLAGRRVLYAAPTYDQTERLWTLVCDALHAPIEGGIFRKNETMRLIELPGTEQRLRAKTAWNADTLRGDYADDLIMDEFQLMNEDAWELVGAPMLLDNDGDAIFIYTPPSLHSRSASKANDPQHAAKLFKKAMARNSDRWATFHFTSRDNPFLSKKALDEIAGDMTALSYRMEIMAEDIDEAPGALWAREVIERTRMTEAPDEGLARVVVGVDPTGTSTGDMAGVIVAGRTLTELYVGADYILHGKPLEWASAAVRAYWDHCADCIVAEANYGGEMVQQTILTVDPTVNIKLVTASRGKQVRAEPIAALYEQGKAHHVGSFPALEDEMALWTPGQKSPNRMDALVFAATELMLGFMRQPGDYGAF